MRSTLLGCYGPVQREGEVIHVLAERLVSLDPLLGTLTPDLASGRAADEAKFDIASRDFH